MIDYQIKIKKVIIENFRLFEKQVIEFSDKNFFSLIGRNGYGKTSLIEAINIALSDNSSKFNNIYEDDFKSDKDIIITIEFDNTFFLSMEDNGWERLFPCKKFTKTIKRRKRSSGDFFSSQFIIDTEYQLITFNRLSPKDYKVELNKFGEYLNKRQQLVWSVSKTTNSYKYTIQSDKIEREFHVNALSLAKKVLFPKVFYFDKNRERELQLKYNTTLNNIVKELNWKFKYEITKNDDILKEKFETYKNLQNENAKLDSLKKKLIEPAIDILQKELNLDFNFNNLNFYLYDFFEPYSNSIFGHLSKNNKLIKMSKSGSGISILVILSLLISYAKNSKTPIIFLIDEPELHLHADLQKSLLNLLKQNSFQTIVATHSNLLIDKVNFSSNYKFSYNSKNKIEIKACNQISLASTIFDILGHSIEDLFIPEDLILVEGKYDVQILEKCLDLEQSSDKKLLITNCSGYTEIPPNTDNFEQFFEKYLNTDKWYSRYFNDKLRIIVDGDVSEEKVNSWKRRYNLSDNQVKHLTVPSLEYLYPEGLIYKLVSEKVLNDDSKFGEKTKDEIIDVILSDEKNKGKKNLIIQQRESHRISKQRLTEYISINLTFKIYRSTECIELKKLVEWIIR